MHSNRENTFSSSTHRMFKKKKLNMCLAIIGSQQITKSDITCLTSEVLHWKNEILETYALIKSILPVPCAESWSHFPRPFLVSPPQRRILRLLRYNSSFHPQSLFIMSLYCIFFMQLTGLWNHLICSFACLLSLPTAHTPKWNAFANSHFGMEPDT